MATTTILVCGFGPGISTAVAAKFGAEGFAVALVARNAERLDAGVKALQAKGIKAAAFPTDLADPENIPGLIGKVRSSLPPIGAILWNAYGGGAGDLLTADLAELRGTLDIAITSLLETVRTVLPELKKAGNPAVLITNGGLYSSDPKVDAVGVSWNAMGLSVANAAKHKLVGLLAEKLKADKIHVAEVVVTGIVKGTAFDQGNGTIEARAVADKFWSLYKDRREIRAQV
jgi:NADP-dependent 3-hydroxy acid dehydrogenase YdfG